MKNLFTNKPPISPTDRSLFSASESRHNFINNSQMSATSNHRNTDNLVYDLQLFYGEIARNVSNLITSGQQEKYDWVSKKQQILSDFNRRLDQTTFPSPTTMNHCENIIQSVQKLLRQILAVPSIGPSALHRRLTSSPQRSPTYGNSNSVHSTNAQQERHHNSMQSTSQIYFPGRATGAISREESSVRKRTAQSTTDFQDQSLFNRRQDGQASVDFVPQNSRDLNINSHYGGGNSNVDSIKEREERLDKDFMKLMERYNHSKILIENIDIQNRSDKDLLAHHNSVQPSQQIRGGQVTGFSKTSSIQASPNQYKSTGNLMDRSTMNINDDLSFIPKSRKGSSSQNNNMNSLRDSIVEGRDDNDQSVAKSIYKLKETISFKENLDREQLVRAQIINQQLKLSLKEYLDKNQFMEQNLQRKDELVMKMESEIQLCQEELLISMERLKEMKTREDGLIRLEQELRESNMEIKDKLLQKKRRNQQMREIMEKNENIMRDYEQQIENLEGILNQTNESMNEYKNQIMMIREENNQLKDESGNQENFMGSIQDENKNLQAQVKELNEKLEIEIRAKSEILRNRDITASQNEELTELMRQLQAKFQRHKAKHEEQQNSLINSKNEQISQQKSKNKTLKAQVAQYESQISDIQTQNIELSQQLQHQLSVFQDHDRVLSETKQELRNLENQNQNLHDQQTHNNQEIQKFVDQIQSLENEFQIMQENTIEQNQEITILRSQNSNLNEKVQGLRQYAGQLESQLQFQQKRQNMEISEIEQRVELLIKQIGDLQLENAELKRKQQENKQELIKQKQQAQDFKDKFMKMKSNNKTLRLHIQQVEEKVKDYMTERMFEMRENEKVKEIQKVQESSAQNKLRVLEEIQNMIRTHRGNFGLNSKLEFN